jgi:hypothetical protein
MCALSGLPKKKLSIYWRDYVAAPTSHKAERIPFSAIYVYPLLTARQWIGRELRKFAALERCADA